MADLDHRITACAARNGITPAMIEAAVAERRRAEAERTRDLRLQVMLRQAEAVVATLDNLSTALRCLDAGLTRALDAFDTARNGRRCR